MSNYLTPPAYQAYSKLLASLRTASLRIVFQNPDNLDLANTVLPPGYLDALLTELKGETSKLSSWEKARFISKQIELVLQNAREYDNQQQNKKDEMEFQRRSNDMNTSPGLEREESELACAIRIANCIIKEKSTSEPLYKILLEIYDRPEVIRIRDVAWMLDIHIGNACRDFVATNREECINFLSLNKSSTVPGNDF